jgi:hypothetical protein
MAEIKTILERNDFTEKINYSGSLGNTPSRAKINDMIAEWTNGSILDGQLPRDVRFLVKDDDGKWFLFMYYKPEDTYLFEKLTHR